MPAGRPLRILFSMRNFWYVRLFESVILELARRGHAVHILAEHGEHNEVARDWNQAAAALSTQYHTISFGWAPRRVEDDWVDLRVMVRLGLDHLRFLKPAYRDTPKLAERARRRTPEWVVSLADRPFWRTRPGRALIAWGLKRAEQAMPIDPDISAYIDAHRPDLIMITPLLTLGSEQQDILRVGRRLGIPTALCVGSWDHLSSKALIREQPHRVLVWNETQKREAVSLHHIPAGHVVVTGAQCFDQWFDRRPTLDREAFCSKVGLDAGRPYILYVCSALFEGSPSEAVFVAEWIAAVRQSTDPVVRDAAILVRPHPKRGFEWEDVDLSGHSEVGLWPPRGAAPFDAPTKADYFDSMYHAAVVVGLNTSALIESGIVGRPVHTILLPEFYENQEGTLHFHYLLDGGLLKAARTLPEHVAQLAASVSADPGVHHNRGFVEAFVRPHGMQTPATPAFVVGIEALAVVRVPVTTDAWWVGPLRRRLEPIARKTSGTFAERNARERRRRAEQRERTERIAAIHAEREAGRNRREADRRRHAEEKQRALALKREVARRKREDDERAKLEAAANRRAAKVAARRAHREETASRTREHVMPGRNRGPGVALRQRIRRVLALFSTSR